MTQIIDDIYRQYSDEFQRTALDFHIPIAQWDRPEVQYLVNFVNRAHQMHEDMLSALESAAFYPEGEDKVDVEQIEGVDDTHRLPNLDGMYKAIQAVESLLEAVELIMRWGFDGDFMKHLSIIQALFNAVSKTLVMP